MTALIHGIAHEIRSMIEVDHIPLRTMARYFRVSQQTILAALNMHRRLYPTMLAFDGNNELWRSFVQERIDLALEGKVSFVFRIPE